jgi:hypothetical protein
MRLLSHTGAWLTIIGIALCCFSSFSAAGGAGKAFLIFNPQTQLQEEVPLGGVNKISISFFHSYDRQWVTESFLIGDNCLIPYEVIYCSDSYDYRHERYKSIHEIKRHSVKSIVTANSEKDSLAQIIYRVGHMESQKLILEKDGSSEIHSFSRWGQPGQRLVLSLH